MAARGGPSPNRRVRRVRPGSGRTKTVVFFGVLVLLVIVVLEAASVLALVVRDRRSPSPALWRQQRERAALESGDAAAGGGRAGGVDPDGMQVIHPFVGFVLNPAFKGIEWREVTSQGFQRLPGEREPPAGAPRFVVAMFGGSVAAGVCLHGREAIVHELQRSPRVRGKTLVVHCVAMGGYKQPQQLMALNYVLSLGETIDVAINLDGFNEVTLPIVENLREGVNPFYPRGWPERVAGAPTADALRMVGRIALWKDERRRGTGWCAARPLSFSPTCHLLWTTFDRRLARRVFEGQQALLGLDSHPASFLARGPAPGDVPRGQVCRLLAEHWARASTLMFDLARARGIVYVHFLQPNQYVPGSKPMGREERLVALAPAHPYKAPVEDCYPSLVEAGRALAGRGVPFRDLSGLFAGHPEPLYEDACCHYNQEGKRLIGQAMGRTVVDALAGSSGAVTP